MTLSVAELADIRLVTGADNTTVMPDATIQAQYDLALAGAPDSTLVLPYAYVFVLRRLWGYQRLRVDRTTTHGDKQTRSQIEDATKELLDYWEGLAGLGGQGILAFGTIDLDLDEDEPVS
jgi:hypothetical protein